MAVKNIVIVNDFGFVNGGTSQVAIDTALSLGNKNYQVFYFCSVLPIDKRLKKNQNVHVICTKQPDILSNSSRISAFFLGLWNWKSAKLFSQLLSSLSPRETVIHFHGWTKALSHSVIHQATQMRYPSIMTMHDYFIACPNGGFYNYPKQHICTLRALSLPCLLTNCDSRNYPEKCWRVARLWIQKNIAGVPDRLTDFICLSHTSQKVLIEYLPPQAKIYWLPTPVETVKTERALAEKNIFIFAIGRFSREKGFDLLAKASRELSLPVVFVGDGEEKNKLQTLNPQAQFPGWLGHQELMLRLREARALVIPSRWFETQGLVANEAASLGIPLIVSDQTAIAEQIEDGVTGIHFATNDVDDLKNKLLQLSSDEKVAQLSINLYDYFWDKYEPVDNYLAQLIEIYESVSQDQRKRLLNV